jgi:hypothetical protein
MMDIARDILEQKDEFYNIAKLYLSKIEEVDFEIDTVVNKSISILLNHEFIVTPCIEIKIKIYCKDDEIYLYCLYLSYNKEFIDEFLILNS